MPGVGKGKDADFGFYQDVSGTNNKISGAEWDYGLGKGAGLLNSPL